MRETELGTMHVAARGDWEHPLHRGNWTRILVTEADITWTTTTGTHRLRVDVQTVNTDGTQLAVTCNGTTTRRSLQAPPVLALPILATLGTSIARVASQALDTVEPALPDLLGKQPGFAIAVHQYAAEVLGRDEIATPDGPVRGYAYRYVGAGYSQDDLFLLGGDGLLAAYRVGDTTAWRAASAPS